mmetsp:Transcript_6952/g.19367  ORF Transcript_6952/g.19367 Transcript_6952/m.19367 type:complete len:242 (-) Transcript_6952:915-1640(-)
MPLPRFVLEGRRGATCTLTFTLFAFCFGSAPQVLGAMALAVEAEEACDEVFCTADPQGDTDLATCTVFACATVMLSPPTSDDGFSTASKGSSTPDMLSSVRFLSWSSNPWTMLWKFAEELSIEGLSGKTRFPSSSAIRLRNRLISRSLFFSCCAEPSDTLKRLRPRERGADLSLGEAMRCPAFALVRSAPKKSAQCCRRWLPFEDNLATSGFDCFDCLDDVLQATLDEVLVTTGGSIYPTD